jgi:hypothetical protein
MGRTRVHFVRCLITAKKLVRAKISTLRRDIATSLMRPLDWYRSNLVRAQIGRSLTAIT